MYLYLIRHGQSEGNQLNKIQGWQDFPLSPLGKQQVEKLGQFFRSQKLDAIYSSDLTRAYETANKIAEATNIPVQKSELFREIKLGPLEGKTKQEIYSQFPEAKERTLLTSGVPGTETIEEITNRSEKIINKLREHGEGEHIALVTHGGLISILLMYIILEKDWHRFHRPFQIENTSISLIEFSKDRKPLIHYTNQTNHLTKVMTKL